MIQKFRLNFNELLRGVPHCEAASGAGDLSERLRPPGPAYSCESSDTAGDTAACG